VYADLCENISMCLPSQKTNTIDLFLSFSRLTFPERLAMLISEGRLLDIFEDKNSRIKIYFFNGFFAELIECLSTGKILEVIPYKNGYRLHHFSN
jgi:hypothetical protein